jgi:hypothetical protein
MCMYAQYIQGLCQFRLGTAEQTQNHVAQNSCPSYMLDHHQVWASSIFFVRLHHFQYCKHMHFHDFVWPVLVACTISLCKYKYTVLGKPHATRGPVCAIDIYQWRGEPLFFGGRGGSIPIYFKKPVPVHVMNKRSALYEKQRFVNLLSRS